MNNKMNILFLAVVLLLSAKSGSAEVKACNEIGQNTTAFQNTEKKLFGCLLSDHDKRVRPVKAANETVTVNMGLATLTVDDIDEKNQMLKIKGWLFQNWKDPHLTWDPAKYDNIKEIRIPINDIWKPDTVMYNYAESISLRDETDSLAVVSHDGTVQYFPLSTSMKSSCQLDLSRFPYDTQRCHMIFGPWTSNVHTVNITVDKVEVNIWHTGKEWKVLESKLERQEYDFGKSYGGRFSVAISTITMERNPVYYKYIFVLPTVLLAGICLIIYLVPPEAGERLTMCGSVLIACTILLLMLENHLPTEVADPPLLLRYLIFIFIMDVFAIFVTILSLNFHYRDIRRGKVPNWMKKIFLGRLSRILCIKGDVYSSLPTSEESTFDSSSTELPNRASPRDLRVDQELTDTTPLPKSPTMAIEKTMDEIRRYLRICAAKATLPEPVVPHKQVVINEWHHVALVLDRLAFVFFTAITIFVALVMAAM